MLNEIKNTLYKYVRRDIDHFLGFLASYNYPCIKQKEVKNFLAENFANFSSQETLSFSFNPEIIPQVADSIGRLAEQNDFEGKISVHKDISLGLSDCRVEWKSGGVERKTSSFINKIKNIVNTNKQERENG